jgi:hypothetical protein
LFFFPSPSPSDGALRDFLLIPLFVPLYSVELKKEKVWGKKKKKEEGRGKARLNVKKRRRRLQKGPVTK